MRCRCQIFHPGVKKSRMNVFFYVFWCKKSCFGVFFGVTFWAENGAVVSTKWHISRMTQARDGQSTGTPCCRHQNDHQPAMLCWPNTRWGLILIRPVFHSAHFSLVIFSWPISTVSIVDQIPFSLCPLFTLFIFHSACFLLDQCSLCHLFLANFAISMSCLVDQIPGEASFSLSPFFNCKSWDWGGGAEYSVQYWVL